MPNAFSPITPFGLYIHWPFCVSKCPYCDFNSHVRAAIDEDQWQNAFLKELDFIGNMTKGRVLTSVFFGGGTPSLMPPALTAALLDRLATYWILDPNMEITLEANPNSVEIARLQAFKQAGINRLSLGVQSLYEESLRFLGRQHNRLEALNAIDIGKKLFDRFSFDLIYARPNQTLKEWDKELTEALAMAGDHLSLYQLTIEPGTAFYTAFHRGDWHLPEDTLSADFLSLTQERLAASGRPAYEVSNYARQGQESRHNLTYWRYYDYAGIGPGAHGRLTLEGTTYATRAHKVPETWLKAVLQDHGLAEKTPLLAKDCFWEALLMGLRLYEGVSLKRLYSLDPSLAERLLDSQYLVDLKQEGLMRRSSSHLIASQEGLLRLNALISYLYNEL